MPWDDKQMKKNQAGEVVPQAYSDAAGDYEPVKSTGGALHSRTEDGADVAAGAKADPAETNPALAASRTGLLKGLLTVLNFLLAKFASGTVIGKVEQGNGAGNALSPWAVESADGDIDSLGARNDEAANSDAGTFSLIALFKRLLQKWTAGISVTNFPPNQTVSGTVTANQGTAGAAPWPVALSGRTVTDDVTLQDNAGATGNGNRMAVDGYDTAVLTVSGVFVGSLAWQVSTVADPQTDADWETKFAQRIGTGVDAVTATTTGIYVMSVSGIRWVRAPFTRTSGNVTVKGRAIAGTTPTKAVLAVLQNLEGTSGQAAPAKTIGTGVVTGAGALVSISGLSAIGDGGAGASTQAAGMLGFNGSAWDRLRTTATAGTAQAGTGVQAVAQHLFGGASTYTPAQAVSNISDGIAGAGVQAAGIAGFNGSTWDRFRVANIFKYATAVLAALGTLAVWTPAAGKKFRLFGLILGASADVNLTLKDAAGGTTFMVVPIKAGTVETIILPTNGRLSAAINNVLELVCSGNATVYVSAIGTEE